MVQSKSDRQAKISLVINDYFETFNRHEFTATAALFSSTGKLQVPFESPIQGRNQILAYLQQEASQMTAYPMEYWIEAEGKESARAIIQGQVQTVAFRVGVEWQFVFTPETEIAVACVKLLDSLKALLSLRQHR